jgi:hypothetical protein
MTFRPFGTRPSAGTKAAASRRTPRRLPPQLARKFWDG